MTDHILVARQRLAKQLAAFYAGEGPYPLGLPPLLSNYDTKNMWDTAPYAYRYSEYGNNAGSV